MLLVTSIIMILFIIDCFCLLVLSLIGAVALVMAILKIQILPAIIIVLIVQLLLFGCVFFLAKAEDVL